MKIGIIGGTGLYDLPGIERTGEVKPQTPFGEPSDALAVGRLGAHEVYFLPRHGVGHRILPSEINHRANIFALKALGVERAISISAVGSLREDMRPRDIVLPDQYFDRTKASSQHTFFGRGIVGHVAFGEPVCGELRGALAATARATAAARGEWNGLRVFDGGVYVNMEGPAFSTRAEAEFHRRCGFDVIGMTSLAEARLCREAELCYAALAMVTDYDCWHTEHESVTIDLVLGHLRANAEFARVALAHVLQALPAVRTCACGESLKCAIMTRHDLIPEERKRELAPIIGKYVC